MDIKIETEEFNFKFRVSGVIINNDKVLLVDMDKSGFLCFPGGYVELGEESQKAIEREVLEEVNIKVKVLKYLGVIENYFINKYQRKIHEICFYYLLEPVDEIETLNFSLVEKGEYRDTMLDFKWINIENLDKYDIRPKIMKDILKENKIEFKHLVVKE